MDHGGRVRSQEQQKLGAQGAGVGPPTPALKLLTPGSAQQRGLREGRPGRGPVGKGAPGPPGRGQSSPATAAPAWELPPTGHPPPPKPLSHQGATADRAEIHLCVFTGLRWGHGAHASLQRPRVQEAADMPADPRPPLTPGYHSHSRRFFSSFQNHVLKAMNTSTSRSPEAGVPNPQATDRYRSVAC